MWEEDGWRARNGERRDIAGGRPVPETEAEFVDIPFVGAPLTVFRRQRCNLHRKQHGIRSTLMAKQAPASTRLPRGTKPVAQAFLTALDTVPEQSRAAVSKAALSMIRDEIKASRERQRASRSESAASAKTARGPKTGRRTRVTKRERPEANAADTNAAETAEKP